MLVNKKTDRNIQFEVCNILQIKMLRRVVLVTVLYYENMLYDAYTH